MACVTVSSLNLNPSMYKNSSNKFNVHIAQHHMPKPQLIKTHKELMFFN